MNLTRLEKVDDVQLGIREHEINHSSSQFLLLSMFCDFLVELSLPFFGTDGEL